MPIWDQLLSWTVDLALSRSKFPPTESNILFYSCMDWHCVQYVLCSLHSKVYVKPFIVFNFLLLVSSPVSTVPVSEVNTNTNITKLLSSVVEILTQDTTIFFSSYGFVSRTDWTNENHKLKNVNSWNKTRLVCWQGGHREITSIRRLRTDLNAVPPHDKLSSWIRVWLWLTAELMLDLCFSFVFSDSSRPR